MPEAFESWFESEAPVDRPTCEKHGFSHQLICGRCGTFCCEACIDIKDPSLCDRCGAIYAKERERSQVIGVAFKLALAPAFVAVSAASLALRHHDVPAAFAIFVVPLLCIWGLLRTGRPGFAWLGTFSTMLVLGWVMWNLVDTGDWSRFVDVAMLAIGPVVSFKGCLDLSKGRSLQSLRETLAVI
ncbi:MAG: hypothetical protein QM723_02235 [Myxococcaceae bacterium]